MDMFQITETRYAEYDAGLKAYEDLVTIASLINFKRIDISMRTVKKTMTGKVERQIGYYSDWSNCYDEIKSNSIVLLQHPFWSRHLTRNVILGRLKKRKNVKFISIVHDVERLRGRYSLYLDK
jgi:hypothetical protein